jgi:4-amino-4-deoxy-L-arabinose transferase-like glycosyltransferase
METTQPQSYTAPVVSEYTRVSKRAKGRALLPGSPARPESRWGWSQHILLLLSLVSGAIAHGYHMFLYPLYVTDEGIYMEQAWAVLREGLLSPYTYFYDHAPAGWLIISGWVSLLPFQFQTFGNAINTGRVLMLIAHVASIFLLFHITYRFSGSTLAAVLATFLFNFSPLAIFYQREVLLDNLMVFWLLLSLYLVTRDDGRIVTPMLSGLAFGICVLTKENTIFFGPIFGYLLYTQVCERLNYRFALGSWCYMSIAVISLYFLYAALKNELLPSHFDFDLNNPPADHVSLLYSIWWQLNRSNGGILDPRSYFWFVMEVWKSKDVFILVGGVVAMFINFLIGLQNRSQNRGYLVAALLAASYTFYVVRGSVMLEFYIVPLFPLLAMNVGMLASHVLRPLYKSQWKVFPIVSQGVFAIAFCGALLSPLGSYFLVHDEFGKVVRHDLYKLPLTEMQAEQLAFIRQHIPPTAKIIMDDELWVDLHDVAPYYKYAHSHWKAAGDPDVRDKLFRKDWHNIDYIVMSNQMLQAMQQNNGDGSESWILEGLSHAQRIWDLKRGGIELQIYQVEK